MPQQTVPDPLIDILMGTFNGAAHVQAQIASLQAQTHHSWRLLVRDDGSNDDTVAVVDLLASEDPRIERLVDSDGNLGFVGNFERLLTCATAPYVMFCDQDDVWMPDKLSATMKRMRQVEADHPGAPALVHCDACLVDADLNTLNASFTGRRARRRGLPSVLFGNCVQGAASMINAALRSRMLQSSAQLSHDYKAALIAELIGVRSFVDQPLLMYRQHADNAVGAGATGMGRDKLAPTPLPRNLRLAMRSAPHVECLIAQLEPELTPSVRREARRYQYVLHGPSRLRRAWRFFRGGYAFPGRRDRWRFIAAILRGEV